RFSVDGRYLLCPVNVDNWRGWTTIFVWDVQEKKVLHDLDIGQGNSAIQFAFAPDKRTVAIATSTSPLSGITGKAAGKELQLWDLPTGQQRAIVPLAGEQVHALVFSADGKKLAAGFPNEVQVWDVNRLPLEKLSSDDKSERKRAVPKPRAR